MNNEIAVALISGVCVAVPSITATFIMNRKNNAIQSYRLEELTKHVEKHNKVVERTYVVEKAIAVLDNRQKVSEHRLNDLEKER